MDKKLFTNRHPFFERGGVDVTYIESNCTTQIADNCNSCYVHFFFTFCLLLNKMTAMIVRLGLAYTRISISMSTNHSEMGPVRDINNKEHLSVSPFSNSWSMFFGRIFSFQTIIWNAAENERFSRETPFSAQNLKWNNSAQLSDRNSLQANPVLDDL